MYDVHKAYCLTPFAKIYYLRLPQGLHVKLLKFILIEFYHLWFHVLMARVNMWILDIQSLIEISSPSHRVQIFIHFHIDMKVIWQIHMIIRWGLLNKSNIETSSPSLRSALWYWFRQLYLSYLSYLYIILGSYKETSQLEKIKYQWICPTSLDWCYRLSIDTSRNIIRHSTQYERKTGKHCSDYEIRNDELWSISLEVFGEKIPWNIDSGVYWYEVLGHTLQFEGLLCVLNVCV